MTALLVVDVQKDFCPDGRLAVPRGQEVVPLINGLSAAFEHVILTQDWHPEGHVSFASSHPGTEPYDTIDLEYGEQTLWPDHCVQGTRGAAFHPGLEVDRAELILRKGFRPNVDSYSAFYENDHETRTGLAGYLRERDIGTLYLVGLALDFCVHWSAIDGRREGFEIFVIKDATRAIDTGGSLSAAMNRMRDEGVHMVTTDEVRAII